MDWDHNKNGLGSQQEWTGTTTRMDWDPQHEATYVTFVIKKGLM